MSVKIKGKKMQSLLGKQKRFIIWSENKLKNEMKCVYPHSTGVLSFFLFELWFLKHLFIWFIKYYRNSLMLLLAACQSVCCCVHHPTLCSYWPAIVYNIVLCLLEGEVILILKGWDFSSITAWCNSINLCMLWVPRGGYPQNFSS